MLTRLLVAASPQASTDDLLDWIVWLAEFGRIGCRRALEAWYPSARLATRLG